jgi:type II secretory pathway component PulJ
VKRQHRKRGVTLAEVLVATAFLGICSAALVDTTTQTAANLARTERRAVALSALGDRMEVTIQQIRRSGTLPSVITTAANLPGGGSVRVKTTPSMSAYTKVALVVGEASWAERIGGRVRTETLTMEVYARCPDEF